MLTAWLFVCFKDEAGTDAYSWPIEPTEKHRQGAFTHSREMDKEWKLETARAGRKTAETTCGRPHHNDGAETTLFYPPLVSVMGRMTPPGVSTS